MPIDHRHFLHTLFEPKSLVLISEPQAPAWVRAIGRGLKRAKLPATVVRLGARKRAGFGVAAVFGQGEKVAASEAAGPVELALIATDAARVAQAISLAASMGARAVCVLSERADNGQPAAWLAQARELGLRLLGPGTLGFIRPSLALNASRMGEMPPAGQVALVSQSGALNAAVLDWVGEPSVGFSLVASLGAESDIDLAQVLDYLSSDAETRAVVVYLEAVHDSRSFISALRALALVKPVIVLKGHRDDHAPRGGLTHSGAIIGADAIYSAALRRAGAVQIGLFTQLFTAARILASHPGPLGQRLGVIANGNGPAVLAADQAWFHRLRLPELDVVTGQALATALPACVTGNPLNLGVDATASHYQAALRAMAADASIDGVLVMLAPHGGVDIEGITQAVIDTAAGIRKPVFACWMGNRQMRPMARKLGEAGLPVFSVPESAVDAYATVASFHQNQRLLQQSPRPLAERQAPDVQAARAIIDEALAQGQSLLDEIRAKALLASFGVPVTPTMLARDLNQALAHAEALGYPVVLKISAPGIAHKSDIGGVVLNVRNAAELREQHAAILRAAQGAHSVEGPHERSAEIEGVSVQPMRGGRFGRELYIGVFRDPRFGPVIAFGAGGVRVELTRDTTLEFPPLNRFLARRMIERTRIAEALGAFRGAPPVELQALEALLVAVSDMVCELPWIAELDINPVIADEHGVVAVDARVVLDASVGTQPARHRHMAIMPYPAHLIRSFTTPQGEPWRLRPIQAEDADALQAFVRGLSTESRYFRFISVLAELPPRMLIRYTQLDYDRELALVAVTQTQASPDQPQTERIVGVVRYLLNADRESCEFAVAIADGWQGRRLGSTLMRAIIEAAGAKGLREIEGHVLAANARMLALMRHLGFSVKTDPEDASMKRVWMSLPPASLSPPAGDTR